MLLREPPNAGLHLVAGELCLDFANTAAWHASAKPKESLGTFPDLVAWGRRVGLLNASRAERLLREAGKNPVAAAAALRRAIAVREVMYRMVCSHTSGKAAPGLGSHHLQQGAECCVAASSCGFWTAGLRLGLGITPRRTRRHAVADPAFGGGSADLGAAAEDRPVRR